MKIYDMTRKDFEKLPCRKWGKDIGKFDSLIILPSQLNIFSVLKYKLKKLITKIFKLKEPDIWEVEGIHDSGYLLMDFVAVKNNKPLCRLSGYSDVLHIDGIGGHGRWTPPDLPKLIEPKGWSIDCLPNSGLLRLFGKGDMTVGDALSSFEVYLTSNRKDKVDDL